MTSSPETATESGITCTTIGECKVFANVIAYYFSYFLYFTKYLIRQKAPNRIIIIRERIRLSFYSGHPGQIK